MQEQASLCTTQVYVQTEALRHPRSGSISVILELRRHVNVISPTPPRANNQTLDGASRRTRCLQCVHTMRRRRSDELPRYARDGDSRSFRFHRRYAYYLCGFLFVCWFLYPSPGRTSTKDATNWSNYAYSLYATDSATLCHALLLFDALARLGSRADRVLFYPQHWDTEVTSAKDRDSQLLVLARDKYNAKLHPVKLLTVEGRTKGTMSGDPLHANLPPYACKAPREWTGC